MESHSTTGNADWFQSITDCAHGFIQSALDFGGSHTSDAVLQAEKFIDVENLAAQCGEDADVFFTRISLRIQHAESNLRGVLNIMGSSPLAENPLMVARSLTEFQTNVFATRASMVDIH